jgi:D-glycero-D-manno-heptose 1,7-bisphosphate phosphatase
MNPLHHQPVATAYMAQHLVDGLGLWADIRTQNVSEPRPILFIDRDGVLIEDLGYVRSASQTRLYPGGAEAIATARTLGYRMAIITNQSGIGRGYYDWTDFAAVQDAIDAALARTGTAVDAVFACAYHAEAKGPYAIADHHWRKPRPGMILEGLRRLNGIAAASAMIGDQGSDIAAARAAGLRTAILIDRASTGGKGTGADTVVRSFSEAIAFLHRA